MALRSNFIKADGIPVNFADGHELFKIFNSVGEVVDILATSPTSVIVAYNRRTGAEYAVFALNGQSMGIALQGNILQVSLYVPSTDPNYFSDPSLFGFGANIGQSGHRYNYSSFVPFNLRSAAAVAPTAGMNQQPSTGTRSHGANYQQPNFGAMPAAGIQLPNYTFNPNVALRPSMLQTQTSNGNQGPGAVPFVQNFSQTNFLPNGASTSQPGPMTNGWNGQASQGASLMDVTSSQSNTRVTGQFGDILSKHTKAYAPSDDTKDCNICLCELGTKQTYDENSNRVLTLSGCDHGYHQACLEAMLQNSPSEYLQCPLCKKVHGVKTGTMPPGQISHRLINSNLPGYENCGTIEITFSFRPGLQGPEHPNPGRYYQCIGFPRVAYLPDCDAGVRMLHGIYIAWQQKVMFTVGRSITTGRDDCVTWNDIHMKTFMQAAEHGYPDPAYLKNLAQDLTGFGIMESEISRHMAENQGLKQRGHL